MPRHKPPGHAFTGTYREITPPARLVFGLPAPGGADSLGTIEFEERAGQTTLTLTMTAASSKARDAMLEMRVDAGTARTLDNLGEYLAKIIAGVLSGLESFFLSCIETGQATGTITRAMPAQTLARHLLGVSIGVRVLARVRPERALLKGVVAPALALLDYSNETI